MSVPITAIEKNPNDPPVLAIFPAGIPQSIEKDPKFKFQIYHNAEQRKGKQSLLYAETPSTHFVGLNTSNDSQFRPPCNFAIGVFNPSKGTLKVAPANTCFTVYERNNKDLVEEEETVTTSSFEELRTQLTERFGSLKRRKDLRSQTANKVDIDASEASAFAAQAALAAAKGMEETKLEQDESNPLIPPHDATTTQPEKIYPFSGLLPENLWSHIPTKPLTHARGSTEQLAELFPGFVLARMDRLRTLPEQEQTQLARMLMYLTYLMLITRVRHHSKITTYLGCSQALADYFASTFSNDGVTSATAEQFSKTSVIKMKIYICILALKCNPSAALDENDLTVIASDLKTTVSELLPFFRAAGCNPARKTRCALSAPLKLPKLGDEFRGGRKE